MASAFAGVAGVAGRDKPELRAGALQEGFQGLRARAVLRLPELIVLMVPVSVWRAVRATCIHCHCIPASIHLNYTNFPAMQLELPMSHASVSNLILDIWGVSSMDSHSLLQIC